MARLKTLLLDQEKWDLVLDSNGNIAVAEPPYSLAQDVASAIRVFLGEVWYDSTIGTPYFENVLGKLPPLSLLTAYMETAALRVPGVVSVKVIIQSYEGRTVTGQVQFIDEEGVANNVSF